LFFIRGVLRDIIGEHSAVSSQQLALASWFLMSWGVPKT
jgi:hypothetical protein